MALSRPVSNAFALLLVVPFFTAACGDDGGTGGQAQGGETSQGGDAAQGGNGQGGDGNGGDNQGGSGGIGGATGTLDVTLEADGGAATDEIVSLGVPFGPGGFADPALIVVRDDTGTEIPAHSETLATWPADGSQRSVLVAFRATLAASETRTFTIDYGAPRTLDAGPLAPNPDGPVAATLDPRWYAETRVLGFQVALPDSTAFPGWESEIESYLADMDPAWESYGLSCASTSAERTYYDGPHALYQRFAHRSGAAAYRRAREEAVWYRDNEINWFDGDTVALYACTADWDPSEPLAWGDMRRMLGQGMLDDYLMTGDPAAAATVRGLGEAFRQNLVALTTGNEITVKVTERNMAWPMMGLASYYAIEPTSEVRTALDTLVDMTIAWQGEGTSGAFEHDINRPDPEECGDGPSGASPFMTSLLVDGLMDAYILTGDAGIPPVVVQVAEWFRDDAITSDGVAFEYLWGCNDVDYDDSGTADLNILISHVFGAAYVCSDDATWLTFGDTMANHGIDNIYAGAPKQWSQSARTFMKYMGYRATELAP
jgi:hypothetical protein